ncbi:MAG: hypothetical protein GY841_19395 [FCB group bacterium]|nr:hypothetical protein [FCB group bacterium]
MMSGNVVGAEIGKKGDSTTDTVILDVMFTDRDDVRPVEWLPGPGEDSTPVDGSRVVVYELSSGYLVAIGGNDGAVPVSTAGTKEIYSTDSDHGKKARIVCNPDGSIDIIAPAGLNITADTTVAGDTEMTGTLTVTGVIKSLVDIIADYAATAISLLTHFHQGNLGFPTGAPIQSGGGTTPSSLPSADSTGEITDGLGTKSTNHGHPYTWTDPGGSGTTGPAS